MTKSLPEISKQIHTKDLIDLFDKKYSEISPVWMPMQMEWLSNVYRTFYDYEKFLIIMHLMTKTFDFYSKNFVKLNYEEFFNQSAVEIQEINLIEISKSLNIPKETTRRKVFELEQLGTIKKFKKKIIIDRSTWPNIQPHDTIQRISRFLSSLTIILCKEKVMSKTISSDQIGIVAKKNFSYVWKLYYEMQMPMLLSFKEIFRDLESFHIWGICVVNQALNSKKNDNSQMNKDDYIDRYYFNSNNKNRVGINAMSISEITGIPRATVIRKLNKLIDENFLLIDEKKQYLTTGIHKEKLIEVQKNNFVNLSKFSVRIYNLTIS